MLDALIRWSVHHPWIVTLLACVCACAGAVAAWTSPVDVLPELAVPSLTVVAEGHGAGVEELELEVTTPIETALADIPGTTRIISTTGRGIALIRLEFDSQGALEAAHTDADSLVRDRLRELAPALPPDIEPPFVAPPTSILGEVMFVGVSGDPRAARIHAEALRETLRRVEGVAEVSLIGGSEPTWDVELDPAALQRHGVLATDALRALQSKPDLEDESALGAVTLGDGKVSLSSVAAIRAGVAQSQGAGSVNGEPAVVLGIQKAPRVNSLRLSDRLDAALDATAVPKGLTLHRDLFRQADFIEAAVGNITHALRDGSILVILIVLIFLASGRSTFISALAIPLSLLSGVLVLRALGAGIDTMTLGGMTIAVGAIVDDAIIDVENVVRRLRQREAMRADERLPVATVVYQASREIRGSIVFATVVIALVFAPLFFLTGFEGKLLRPLGFAYVAALGGSLVTALTVTPALCVLLLPRSRTVRNGRTPWLARTLESLYGAVLAPVVRHWLPLTAGALVVAAGAGYMVIRADRNFLPPFNEASLTIEASAKPGTSLEEADRLGAALETQMLSHPMVRTTARRTGRAAGDEHAQPVHSAEIDVRLAPEANLGEVVSDLRFQFDRKPLELETHIGAPIAHRVDHTLADAPANVAVKIYGSDLDTLTRSAAQVREIMAGQPNVADAWVAKLRTEPRTVTTIAPETAARLGVPVKTLREAIEIAEEGHRAARAGGRSVVLRHKKGSSGQIGTPSGWLPIASVATRERRDAPVAIRHQNGQRVATVVVAATGRDLVGTVDQLRAALSEAFETPKGYRVAFEGQYEVAQRAQRTLVIVSIFVFVGVFALLVWAFRSAADALVVLMNLPLALVGGAAALPFSGGLSVATLIGFIALFGIATRNGIMLVSHIRHVVAVEGETDPLAAVLRGARERLAPILMTAAASGLGLLPLAASAWDPGGEIQGPMARVILVGLVSATVLNMFVIPAVYLRFGAIFRRRGATESSKSQPQVDRF